MSLKQETISAMFWTFSQQFGTQIINFIVSLLLARILSPSDFGVIAVFSVFLAIGNVLINSGLTNSLIRTSNVNEIDFSTVFHFNLIVSLLVYIILAISAPFISSFFNMPELTPIIRLYSTTLPISAFSSVQRTLFTKRMDFKTQLKVELPSLIISGIAGISFALAGYGVWSIVYMAIIQAILSSIQYWIYSKWRPQRVFNKEKFKYHFNFGYKLALSGLLDTIFQNLYTIVIGKLYTPNQLGYYNKANTLQMLPVTSISGPLNRITFPLFAKIQGDDVQLKNVYRKILKMVIFLITPLLIIMGVLGEPMIRFLFTEKWLPAVPYFQILCITGVLYPIHAYNLNILQVKGRSDLFLKLEIIKKILLVIVIAITFQFGIIGLLWGKVASSIIGLVINCHYSGKFLNYGVWKQLRDLLPSILISITTGILLSVLDTKILPDNSDFIRLLIGVVSGLITYIGLAYLFKFNELNIVKNILLKN